MRCGTQAETSESNDERGLEEPGGRGRSGPEVDLRRRPFCRETAGVGAMLTLAAYRGFDREMAMRAQGSGGPAHLRFSPYAFNGG